MNADVSVVVAAASQATPLLVTATAALIALHTSRQVRLKPRNICTVKVVPKGVGLLCFEPTQSVARLR